MTEGRRPVVRAPEAAWQRLGELLQLRRAELGYRRRPAFTRERRINIRLVTDIENAYRPNTFLTPTLREIAGAYAVSYDSLIAVLLGHDDELIPARPDPLITDLSLPPIASEARRNADAPYVVAIMETLYDLAAKGITDPGGAQIFGEDTPDAKTWDGIGSRMSVRDRVWLIADLRRRAACRASGAGTG